MSRLTEKISHFSDAAFEAATVAAGWKPEHRSRNRQLAATFMYALIPPGVIYDSFGWGNKGLEHVYGYGGGFIAGTIAGVSGTLAVKHAIRAYNTPPDQPMEISQPMMSQIDAESE